VTGVEIKGYFEILTVLMGFLTPGLEIKGLK